MIIEIILISYLVFYVSIVFYGVKTGWIYLEEEKVKRDRKKNIRLVKDEKDD